MKLTGFEISNFQSHVHLKETVTDGLNGFLGPSNAGKSSILRAIKWNVRNEPSGDAFIRHGTSEASVITHWTDDVDTYAIERTRNRSSKNVYILHKNGEVLEEFTGFGTGVPKMIEDILQMGDGLLNFARQLDAPFLLSETPKRRAEMIGNLEELGRIDEEITKVNQELGALSKEEKRLMKELQAEKKKLSKLDIEIEQEKDKAAFLEMVKNSIQEKQRMIGILEKNRVRLADIRTEMDGLEEETARARRVVANWQDDLPERIEDVKRLEQLHIRMHEIESELKQITFMSERTLDDLVRMTDLITSLKSTFRTMEQFYSRLERNLQDTQTARNSFNPAVANVDLKPIDMQIEQYTAIFRYHKRLQEIEMEEEEARLLVADTKIRIEKHLQDFVEAITEAEICPTCAQSTAGVTTERIEQTIH